MSTDPSTTATSHVMTRLDIATGREFHAFRTAFEDAVPVFDLERHLELISSGGSWADVERLAAQSAPHDFLLYATIDTTPLTALAGHTRAAVEYLMGNHVLAEQIYRHHSDALLYAPLRLLLRADDDGRAVLVLDQPSSVFAGLDRPEITEIGRELDAKVAALLSALDVTVPDQLLG